ncbi:hypothetical protein [Paraburkholderia diazotrophica]|uniref:hypothetical protein n=1 Tax=Paraburkholderia diazotrophica TaxID=667676 RepID=UPI00115F9121|nr:hypothetical protein [Paraburkholderia diazotrophica]
MQQHSNHPNRALLLKTIFKFCIHRLKLTKTAPFLYLNVSASIHSFAPLYGNHQFIFGALSTRVPHPYVQIEARQFGLFKDMDDVSPRVQ